MAYVPSPSCLPASRSVSEYATTSPVARGFAPAPGGTQTFDVFPLLLLVHLLYQVERRGNHVCRSCVRSWSGGAAGGRFSRDRVLERGAQILLLRGLGHVRDDGRERHFGVVQMVVLAKCDDSSTLLATQRTAWWAAGLERISDGGARFASGACMRSSPG